MVACGLPLQIASHPRSRHLKLHGAVPALFRPAWLQQSALGDFLGYPVIWEALIPKGDLWGQSQDGPYVLKTLQNALGRRGNAAKSVVA